MMDYFRAETEEEGPLLERDCKAVGQVIYQYSCGCGQYSQSIHAAT